MQSGSANTGTAKQLPHSSRPAQSSRRMSAKNRIIPLKTKSKTARKSKTAHKNYITKLQTSDSLQTQSSRQNNLTEYSNTSVLISASKDLNLSSAMLSRPGKRRASTPISFHGIKKSRMDYLPLSPIKEGQT